MMNTDTLNKLRAIKHGAFNLRKQAVELLFGNTIWIDRAAQANRVKAVIEKLRPKAVAKPLIRVGSDGDGGYLLPDDLDGLAGCISPGVSDEVGFDLECANRGMRVIMADASVEGPPMEHPSFEFHKKFLGTRNDDVFIRLDDLVAQSGIEGDLLLQIDIEGAEFPVILDCAQETMERFRVIVMEVHDFGHVFGQFGIGAMEAFVDKLMRTHAVVHIHPNNCCGSVRRAGIEIPRVMEFTLYRRDRDLAEGGAETRYPHPLDADNVAGRPPLYLPKIWK